MMPPIRPPSIAASPSGLPRLRRRYRTRRLGRPRSQVKRTHAEAPWARGRSIPDVWNRALGWRGGDGRNSRLHPSLAEDLLARQLLRHAFTNQLADTLLLFRRIQATRPTTVTTITTVFPICCFCARSYISALFVWYFAK